MRAAIFGLFCITLFLTLQRVMEAPLAYFTFFPLGFLAVFYFYAFQEWFFLSFAVVSLGVGYFYSGVGLHSRVTPTLVGTTIASFSFLAYCRYLGQRGVKEAIGRCRHAQEELVNLKQKHTTRLESLLHLEKQVASLINLFEIARDFNECLDLKETTQILFKKVLPELSFEQAKLILLAPEKRPLQISKIYTISRLGVEERSSVEAGSAEEKWLEKALHEKSFSSLGPLWLFPLIPEGEFNALFVVEGAMKEDLAKFEVLASQLALQVRKVRLYEMVRELSIIDGLTGVFVRRHFLERFEEEIKRALKQNFSLSVLMLDIDHFKRYNDEFGHLVGDATLREVAQVLRANVRNVDIVARYGGEEFVVVIPETKEEGALEVAERIRSAAARHSFRVYDEETKVTVSIGISVFPQDLPDPVPVGYDPNFLFELLQRADRALYRAKEEGRNRVVVYRSVGKTLS